MAYSLGYGHDGVLWPGCDCGFDGVLSFYYDYKLILELGTLRR